MTKKVNYQFLNLLLVDIQQQSRSVFFQLNNEGRIKIIYKENSQHIEKMHKGMQRIAGKYCKMDEKNNPVIENGKMVYNTPEHEQALIKEFNTFMAREFDLKY